MIRREAFTRLGRLREDLVTIEDADRFSRLSKIGKTMIDPELMVLHRTGAPIKSVPTLDLNVARLCERLQPIHSPETGAIR